MEERREEDVGYKSTSVANDVPALGLARLFSSLLLLLPVSF
jgi:hypothetical protein